VFNIGLGKGRGGKTHPQVGGFVASIVIWMRESRFPVASSMAARNHTPGTMNVDVEGTCQVNEPEFLMWSGCVR
jgi:hypothetical protein